MQRCLNMSFVGRVVRAVFLFSYYLIAKSKRKISSYLLMLLVRATAKSCGRRVSLVAPATLNVKGRLDIGDDFFCGPGFYFSSNEYSVVEIGSAVMFGPSVKLISGNHVIGSTETHMRYIDQDDPGTKKIVIENGVWVGSGVKILSGAYISEGAVIGAGAVVTSYVPPYCIATGLPAKKIRRRFSDMDLAEILRSTGSCYTFEDVLSKYDQFFE